MLLPSEGSYNAVTIRGVIQYALPSRAVLTYLCYHHRGQRGCYHKRDLCYHHRGHTMLCYHHRGHTMLCYHHRGHVLPS